MFLFRRNCSSYEIRIIKKNDMIELWIKNKIMGLSQSIKVNERRETGAGQ